jgi:hypothetical protein
MEQCIKKHGTKLGDIGKLTKNIEVFCKGLRANKVKASKEAFDELPGVVQCLFLSHAYNILKNKDEYSDDSYLTAFRLFKLFRGKDMKEKDVYESYNNSGVEKLYKEASEASKGSPGATRTRKTYEKEYQKHPSPVNDNDPLHVFYTSLYQEDPKNRLAITWLTEHGVYDGEDREKLISKYKKLAEKSKLIH